MDNDSWVASEYKQFWNLANEIAQKDTDKMKHMEHMVAMFISTFNAPVPTEDCEGEEEDDCEHCNQLPECQERWAREERQN